MIFSAQRKQTIICNAMDTTKEDGFLNDLAEIINLCVGYVSHKYKLSLSDIDIEKTVAEQKIIYDEVNMGFDDFCKNGLPKVIDKKALAFREVWVSKRREVMSEIRNNLTENIDKDFYVSSVLAHFVGVHESIYSNLAIENLSRYEGADLKELIALEKERTEKLVGFINGSFDFWSADETERTFRWACDEYHAFMVEFDCLLLQSGINLLGYLNEKRMQQTYTRQLNEIESRLGMDAEKLIIEAEPKINNTTCQDVNADSRYVNFTSEYNDEELEEIYRRLKRHKYLNSKTTLESFIYVLTGRGSRPSKKIEWIGQKKHLGLFVSEFLDAQESIWVITQNAFQYKNGEPININYLKNYVSRFKNDYTRTKRDEMFVNLLKT